MSSLLAVHELSVRSAVPARVLVEAVSFTLHAGEILTLLGESGSGKSLLAQAIMGTLPPGLRASGAIRVLDVETPADQPDRRRADWGRKLALLPQEPWSALDPTMKAKDQVAESHQYVGNLPAAEARARALQQLEHLGVGTAATHYPFMLSGGMAQRVAFAAATATGAQVLIVDEPTKGLDAELCHQIGALLRAVLAAGGAVLLITHDIALARSLGGTAAVMRDAQIVEQGRAAKVLHTPAHAYTRDLLAADPAAWPTCVVAAPNDNASLLVSAERLTQRFGARTLFDGINLQIRAAERLAIVGPSGSGKTTLGNVLLGLMPPSSGSVKRTGGFAAHRFQKLYQDPLAAFAPHLTLRQALHDLLHRHRLSEQAVPPLLDQLALNDSLLERLPHQVSGGELQRVALLRVLLLEPVLVFADEPTSRLDPITQRQTMQLLSSSLGARDGALLLVTHDAALARQLAARTLVLGKS